jgi:ubiquinone/menaquinone biosynthesis C-methylase UbiE
MTPTYSSRFMDPVTLASHFHLIPGDTVADYGAGKGTFVPLLAEKVGPTGRVVACDINRPFVESIDRTARERGYRQVRALWADLERERGIRVDDEEVHAGFLINTLYQIADRRTAVAELYRTLAPGGVLYVVDWQDSFGGIGPNYDMLIVRDDTIALFEASLFVFEREYPAGTYHYGLMFRKL